MNEDLLSIIIDYSWDFFSDKFKFRFLNEFSNSKKINNKIIKKIKWNDSSIYNTVFSFITILFAEKYKNYINWNLVENYNYNYDFLKEENLSKFAKFVNWEKFGGFFNYDFNELSEKFIRNHHNDIKNWDLISSNPNLSENFIEEFKNFINWDKVSLNPNLTEKFIHKFKYLFDWNKVVKNRNFSEEFIKKNINRIPDNSISTKNNKKVPHYILNEYGNKFDWYVLAWNRNISDELLLKYKENIGKYHWDVVFKRNKISEDSIIKIYKEFNLYNFSYGSYTPLSALQNINVSDKFINIYLGKFSWKQISFCENLSFSFIKKNKNFLYWKIISMIYANKMDDKFINEFEYFIEWKQISIHRKIFSTDFVKKYIGKIHWNKVSKKKKQMRKNYLREKK